jgi:hypothetical protein
MTSTSLIERLDRLNHLAPDEIVAKLNANPWIYGPNIEVEQVTEEMRVAFYDNIHEEWKYGQTRWPALRILHTHGLDGVRHRLGFQVCWVMCASKFEEGMDWPSCPQP